LFLDYGILYYRSDLQDAPETWDQISAVKENIDDLAGKFQKTNTIFIGQFNGKFFIIFMLYFI